MTIWFFADDRGRGLRLGRMDQESTDMADREAESEYLHKLNEILLQNLDIVDSSFKWKTVNYYKDSTISNHPEIHFEDWKLMHNAIKGSFLNYVDQRG